MFFYVALEILDSPEKKAIVCKLSPDTLGVYVAKNSSCVLKEWAKNPCLIPLLHKNRKQ